MLYHEMQNYLYMTLYHNTNTIAKKLNNGLVKTNRWA